MENMGFAEAIEQIVSRDPRYDAEAYFFVREALDYTVKMLDKPTKGEIDKVKRHLDNAKKRVDEASAQHQRNKGNWKGPDNNVSRNLRDLQTQMGEWTEELKKMSAAKARKK